MLHLGQGQGPHQNASDPVESGPLAVEGAVCILHVVLSDSFQIRIIDGLNEGDVDARLSLYPGQIFVHC